MYSFPIGHTAVWLTLMCIDVHNTRLASPWAAQVLCDGTVECAEKFVFVDVFKQSYHSVNIVIVSFVCAFLVYHVGSIEWSHMELSGLSHTLCLSYFLLHPPGQHVAGGTFCLSFFFSQSLFLFPSLSYMNMNMNMYERDDMIWNRRLLCWHVPNDNRVSDWDTVIQKQDGSDGTLASIQNGCPSPTMSRPLSLGEEEKSRNWETGRQAGRWCKRWRGPWEASRAVSWAWASDSDHHLTPPLSRLKLVSLLWSSHPRSHDHSNTPGWCMFRVMLCSHLL